MKSQLYRQIDNLADWIGADSWVLVRCRTHAIVEFHFAAGSIRQTFSTSPGNQRFQVERRAELRRAIGRNL